MKVQFADIGYEGVRYRIEDLPVKIDARDFRLGGKVALSCRLTRRDEQRVAMTGQVRARLILDCDRCLREYPFPVDSTIRLVLEPMAAALEKYRLRDPDLPLDDLDVVEVERPEIDLVEIGRQQLYLALPVRHLCRPDCRGLCPVCGTDLNRDPCSCDRQGKDSPFAVLAALNKKKSN